MPKSAPRRTRRITTGPSLTTAAWIGGYHSKGPRHWSACLAILAQACLERGDDLFCKIRVNLLCISQTLKSHYSIVSVKLTD